MLRQRPYTVLFGCPLDQERDGGEFIWLEPRQHLKVEIPSCGHLRTLAPRRRITCRSPSDRSSLTLRTGSGIAGTAIVQPDGVARD